MNTRDENRILRRSRLVRRGLVYSLSLVVVILVMGGVGFWLMDPNVATLQDGLWLAFTTAATVGYGDIVPSTHLSRAFAVVVVLLGLAVLSLVTASLAAIFVENSVDEDERQIERDLRREIMGLRHQIEALRAEWREIHRPPAPPSITGTSEPDHANAQDAKEDTRQA
jgi:voltage-gated potassium channel